MKPTRIPSLGPGRPQAAPAHLDEPDPEYALEKRRSKETARVSEREIISTTRTSST
jgi:hypothetical protein